MKPYSTGSPLIARYYTDLSRSDFTALGPRLLQNLQSKGRCNVAVTELE